MRILTLLVVVLLLQGCAAFDLPVDFHPTEYRTDVEITVIKRDNLGSPYDRPDLKMKGAHYCYTDKKCTIWIPTGNSACAREVKAHELLHVKFGLFHKGAFILKNC